MLSEQKDDKIIDPYVYELGKIFYYIRLGCILFAVGALLEIFTIIIIFLNTMIYYLIIVSYFTSIPGLILLIVGIFYIVRNLQYLQRYFLNEKKQLFNLPRNLIIYYLIGVISSFLLNLVPLTLISRTTLRYILNIVITVVESLIPLLIAGAFISISVLLLRLNYIDGMSTRIIYSSYVFPVIIILNLVTNLMNLIIGSNFWYIFSFTASIALIVCEIIICIELYFVLMKIDAERIIDFHIKVIL